MAIGIGISPGLLAGPTTFSLARDIFGSGANAGFYYDFGIVSTLFQTTDTSSPVTTAAQTIGRVNDRSPSGNNATQGTAASEPAWQTTYSSYDGTADNLLSALQPGAGDKTLVVCAQGSTASTYAIGAKATNDRCAISLSADGFIRGAVGTNADLLVGNVDIRNADFVALLRIDETTHAELWLNGVKIAETDTVAASNSGIGMMIGALHNINAASNWWAGRIYRALAVQSYVATAQVVPLMRHLGSGIVSF